MASQFNYDLTRKLQDAIGVLVGKAGQSPEVDRAVDVLSQGLVAMSEALSRLRQIEAQIYHAGNEMDRHLGVINSINRRT